MKTVLRDGARLLFLTRCDVLLHPHRNQPVFAYNVPAGYYRVIMRRLLHIREKELLVSIRKDFFPYKYWKPWEAKIYRIINKIQKTGSTENRPRSGRPTKLPADAKAFIEKQMPINDEATSVHRPWSQESRPSGSGGKRSSNAILKIDFTSQKKTAPLGATNFTKVIDQ